MARTSLKYLDKMAEHEEITVEVQRSLKRKRAFLVDKVKKIDSILVKPLKRD